MIKMLGGRKMKNIKFLSKKREGKIEIVLGVFLLLFFIPVLAAQMQVSQYRATKTYVEDALAASNLASAVIDIEVYGISNDVVINDSDNAFGIYKQALKINLNLDDSWECPNKSAISGKVEIFEYIIYNVIDQDIEIYRYDALGNKSYSYMSDSLGSVIAPEGSTIESTSIYSRIGFPVESVFGIVVDAKKEKLVDILKN